ncbi:MAG: hypothetical protein JST68_09795 [Bacteroidetes bacterium]|nr:hypothetical protein [Bacteroidota bacterium]
MELGNRIALICLLLTQTPAQTLPELSFIKSLPQNRLLTFTLVDPGCDHCQHLVSKMNDSSATLNKTALYMVSTSTENKLKTFAKKFGPRLKAEWLTDPQSEFIVKFKPIRSPAIYLYSPDKKLLDYEDNPESLFRILLTIRLSPLSKGEGNTPKPARHSNPH